MPKTILYRGRKLQVDPTVWAEMMRQAHDDKRWASTADPRNICIESQRAIEKYSRMTVEQLAADHYGYFYHRSHLTIGGRLLDPSLAAKWKELTGRSPAFFEVGDHPGT